MIVRRLSSLLCLIRPVCFEPSIETVPVFAPVCVSVQSGPMLRLITWACGLALLGWLAGQGGGGKESQRGRLPAVKATEPQQGWLSVVSEPPDSGSLGGRIP